MKKNLVGLALAGALISSMAQAADVRIGTEGAYAPWNYLDDSGALAGYEIDLGNALCEQAGVSCEWVVNEWDSIIPNLVAGNYDVIMAGMSITAERQEKIDFSIEYFPPEPSRYAALATSDIDVENMSGLKIGVQGATVQAGWLEANMAADNTILSYETADQSVADLAAGNIDVLLADGNFLQPIVDGSAGAMALIGDGISIGGGVGMGMRKGESELQEKMAAALEALKADGTVDRLIAEYFESGPFYSN